MATIQIESAATPLNDNSGPSRPNPPKRYHHKRRRSCVQWWKILPLTYKFFLIVICLIVLLVSYMYLQKLIHSLKQSENEKKSIKYIPDPEHPLPPSSSKLHQFKKGAVCSDAEECSKIGSNIFELGGNIFDAAIATLLCNGIATAQSMGIGGGFVMNVYLHEQKKAFSLNAKEVAPLLATEDMFKTDKDYTEGSLSIGVPGELKGYWELHKEHGKLPWKTLVEPTIKICEEGFNLSKHMSDFIEERLTKDHHLRNSFFNNQTNVKRRQGEHVKLPSVLCDTYKIIAEKGGDDFYKGGLADLIVDDLRDLNSIIERKDLESYKVRWEESLSLALNDNTVYVTPSVTGGPLVAFILNILHGYNFTSKALETDEEKIRTYHRIIESFKYAFGYRTQLTDSQSENTTELIKKMLSTDFANEIRMQINDNETSTDPTHYGGNFNQIMNKGTSHVSILAPNGDAISVTSSINSYFGIGKTGPRTGIIFNNGMNDFAVKKFKNQFDLPASTGNYIAPQKRALSSMSPVIVTNATTGDVQLVIGAAGGTKIPTAVSTVIARLLWFNQNIKEAIDAPRIHHQLLPMQVQYEYGNVKNLIDGLKLLGHEMHRFDDRGSVICAIAQNQTGIFANADYRKAGEVVGL